MVATRRGRGGIGEAAKGAATEATTTGGFVQVHDVEKGKEKAGVSPSKIADVDESPSSPSGSHDKTPVASGGSSKSGSGGNAAATSTGREELKNPGEYEYEIMEKFRGRLSLNSRVNWVEEIEMSLTPGDWQRIQEGPFGSVLSMIRRVQGSGQLIHAMMFNRVHTKKKYETWYRVRGQVARFSLTEFAVISGLNCGTLPPADVSKANKNVVREFFRGREKVPVGDLYRLFLKEQGQTTYKFKLALLMIVEGVFIGSDKGRFVRPWIVRLLRDMDRFYAFPWGRVAYEETHRSLTRSLSSRMKTLSGESSKRPGYAMQGLMLVFQVWIYEAFPQVGKVFATRSAVMSHPRCTRWTSATAADATSIEDFIGRTVVGGRFKGVALLLPEEGEEEVVRDCGFADEVEEEWADNNANRFKGRSTRPTAAKARLTKDTGVVGDSKQLMCTLTDVVNRLQKMDDGMKRLDNQVQNMGTQLLRVVDGMEEIKEHMGLKKRGPPSTPQQVANDDDGVQAADSSRAAMDDDVDRGMKRVCKDVVASVDEDEENEVDGVEVEEEQPPSQSEKRDESHPYELAPPPAAEEPVRKRLKVTFRVGPPEQSEGEGHDVRAGTILLPERFQDWYDSDMAPAMFGLEGCPLTKAFFSTIVTPRKWLSSPHIEEVLISLRKRVSEETDKHRPLVVLDVWWQNYVEKEYTRWQSTKRRYKPLDTLLNYVCGDVPAMFGKSWTDAELIYTPWNLNKNHWVILEINLRMWIITVYDPIVNLYATRRVNTWLQPVAQLLPVILMHFALVEPKYKDKGGQPFEVMRQLNHLPQCEPGDCGVLALRYIDVLTNGEQDLSVLKEEDVDDFRRMIADNVYKSARGTDNM